MRVKEMHPLCCISLESPGIGGGGDSPEAADAAALSRTRSLPASFAAAGGGSDGGGCCGPEETVAGVLYKWTNYGKGWRSRWFVLRNGVLSYAKIRWPEYLNLLPRLDDVHLIGEVSANRLARFDRGAAAASSIRRKSHKPPSSSGVVHLKIQIVLLPVIKKGQINTREEKLREGFLDDRGVKWKPAGSYNLPSAKSLLHLR
ncbi:hypothetical protein AAHE18_01G116300 [Arachis hypogaea]